MGGITGINAGVIQNSIAIVEADGQFDVGGISGDNKIRLPRTPAGSNGNTGHYLSEKSRSKNVTERQDTILAFFPSKPGFWSK
jgi:hypothetical protein